MATAAVLPCSVALFVAFAASAWADDTVPTVPPEPPPVTDVPTVTTPTIPATPTIPTTRKIKRGPKLIQPGVTIGGVLVGGLTKAEARDLVVKRFDRPLTLVAPARKVKVSAQELGASMKLKKAVDTAIRVRQPGFRVVLDVDVKRPKLGRFLRSLAHRTDREPVDASIKLRDFHPVVRDASPGRRLKQVVASRAISLALRKHERTPLELPYKELRPQVTDHDLGSVIVIERNSNRLLYYKGDSLKRTFHVATGQAAYPTPLGDFEIINMQRNPWWYPPQGSAWAAGEQPVPPGPGNPLGTRWMGISSPYVGIHGTPDAASVGYSASHGCIRMLIPQAEWLFNHVEVGTPVFIVAA